MYIIHIEYQELIPFHQAAHRICASKGITVTGEAVDCIGLGLRFVVGRLQIEAK